MSLAIITFGIFAWLWVGLKTWALVVDDFSERRGKPSVVFGFFAGIAWPLTYMALTIILVGGAILGYSTKRATGSIINHWKGD